ncbi:MAG: hypothetical protein LRY73_05480 [Bacillus sp. (in: Bacteria)]|nr:hypothetical protein [Bacillus sp. (in: firmicutes)]
MNANNIEHKDINAINERGKKYSQYRNKNLFLAEMVVEEDKISTVYVVINPDEEKQLLKSLNKKNPILNDEEIIKILT